MAMNQELGACPIVGCVAVNHPEAGEFHHRWFVVDEQGIQLPRDLAAGLQTVTLEIRYGELVLRAPGMLRLDIPMDVLEDDDSVRRVTHASGQALDTIDEGDLAAAWFSNLLGVSCRLAKLHPDAPTPEFR